VPEFVSWMLCVLVLSRYNIPKTDARRTTEICAALTVRLAALLVTLPAVLLTNTVNCAPLSEVVVLGWCSWRKSRR